jgi:SAM-dependent methyltransferase
MRLLGRSSDLPPRRLAKRVGGTYGEEFLRQGEMFKQALLCSLPPDFRLANKRVLDFGCGVGRFLRHFAPEAREAEFWGCDIYAPGIRWLRRNLPQFQTFVNRGQPPLPVGDGDFDLIYSISVFTHLTETWLAWLEELRRVLRPDGVALVTFHDRLAYEHMLQRPFNEDEVGMLARDPNQSWRKGGPTVFHSSRWVIENWAKVFRVAALFEAGMGNWQTIAVLRHPDHAAPAAPPLVVRPYSYAPWMDGFRGTIDYDVFEGGSWWRQHGLRLGAGGTVGGWFASRSGPVERIEFAVDGAPVPTLELRREPRPDVAAAVPGAPLDSGFEADVDLGAVAPGAHELAVSAVDVAGRRYRVTAPLYRREGEGR